MEYNIKHYAYLGDCVWELFVRKTVIQKTASQALMHKLSTKYVCAQFQAGLMERISDILKPDELEVKQRGRNIKMTINKRSNPALHACATSFEALVGYLYLNKKERLDEIFDIIKPMLDENNEK